jgi:hypothetical protein
MQRLNTGLPGYKTENMNSLDIRLGKARDLHRGLSGFVEE